MKQVSAKQSVINRTYKILRDQYLEDNPYCEIEWDGRCEIYAVEVDHRTDRSLRKDLVLDVNNFQATCRPCHNAKGNNPAEARERGLKGSSWD